jgi:hypothetical protein
MSVGFGGLLILLPIFFVIPALCVWAAIDAGSKPDWAFEAAGTSKTLWIVLPLVGFFVCFVGIVAALMWFLAYRARVLDAFRRGPGFTTPPMPPPAPPR